MNRHCHGPFPSCSHGQPQYTTFRASPVDGFEARTCVTLPESSCQPCIIAPVSDLHLGSRPFVQARISSRSKRKMLDPGGLRYGMRSFGDHLINRAWFDSKNLCNFRYLEKLWPNLRCARIRICAHSSTSKTCSKRESSAITQRLSATCSTLLFDCSDHIESTAVPVAEHLVRWIV